MGSHGGFLLGSMFGWFVQGLEKVMPQPVPREKQDVQVWGPQADAGKQGQGAGFRAVGVDVCAGASVGPLPVRPCCRVCSTAVGGREERALGWAGGAGTVPDAALSSWQGAAATAFSPVEESKCSPLTPCPSAVRFWDRVPEESKFLLLGV